MAYEGLRTVLCYHCPYTRRLHPSLSVVFDTDQPDAAHLKQAIKQLDSSVQCLWEGTRSICTFTTVPFNVP